MLEQLRIVLANLREQRRAESLSREQFEGLKLEKFRRLAVHAADRSPYYARIVRERGIVPARCAPGDFPVLTKPELMAHFDEIVTAPGVTKRGIAEFLTTSHDPSERFLDRYRVIHTSGSSGEVGYFVYSPSDWARGVWPAPRRLRASPPRRKRGFRKPRFAYYGATDGHYAGVTMVANVPFYSFKDFNLRRSVPFWAVLLIVLALVMVSANPPLVLFGLFVAYGFSGYVMWLWKRRRRLPR